MANFNVNTNFVNKCVNSYNKLNVTRTSNLKSGLSVNKLHKPKHGTHKPIFVSFIVASAIDLADFSFLPNSLVSMLTFFSMSSTDEGYILIFSYTKLFLVDLKLNNKVVFSPLRPLQRSAATSLLCQGVL